MVCHQQLRCLPNIAVPLCVDMAARNLWPLLLTACMYAMYACEFCPCLSFALPGLSLIATTAFGIIDVNSRSHALDRSVSRLVARSP